MALLHVSTHCWQQLAPPATAQAVRCMASLHALLGAPSSWGGPAAPPERSGAAQHISPQQPRQQQPPLELEQPPLELEQPQQEQQPLLPGAGQLPSLCGEPKNKLSLHRRGNRRISFYAQRKELFAACKHCGQTSLPHQFFAGGQHCTGECLRAWPDKKYTQEYKPPC